MSDYINVFIWMFLDEKGMSHFVVLLATVLTMVVILVARYRNCDVWAKQKSEKNRWINNHFLLFVLGLVIFITGGAFVLLAFSMLMSIIFAKLYDGENINYGIVFAILLFFIIIIKIAVMYNDNMLYWIILVIAVYGFIVLEDYKFYGFSFVNTLASPLALSNAVALMVSLILCCGFDVISIHRILFGLIPL